MKLICLLLVASLVGCDWVNHSPESPKPQSSTAYEVGRFQPFKNLAGVALDTKTGQLCRTYDWHTPKNDSRVIDFNHFDTAPLCAELMNCLGDYEFEFLHEGKRYHCTVVAGKYNCNPVREN